MLFHAIYLFTIQNIWAATSRKHTSEHVRPANIQISLLHTFDSSKGESDQSSLAARRNFGSKVSPCCQRRLIRLRGFESSLGVHIRRCLFHTESQFITDKIYGSYTGRRHYENTPIQIYWKFYNQKNEKFHIKNSDISAQNIDCGYLLEPSRRGGSYVYPQSMFLSRNKRNNIYPCKPQFYYIKVGFKGVKII